MFTVVALVTFVGAVWIPAVYAQEPPKVTRKVLLKQDMTIPDREAVMVVVELQPGSEEGRHTLPPNCTFLFKKEPYCSRVRERRT